MADLAMDVVDCTHLQTISPKTENVPVYSVDWHVAILQHTIVFHEILPVARGFKLGENCPSARSRVLINFRDIPVDQ